MPQFEITLTKDLLGSGGVTWSNNYNIIADNILDAADYADDIAAIEAAVLWDNIEIIRARIGPATGGGGYNKTMAVLGGRADADPDVQLPLFNTVLVEFFPNTGRPSLKYLRLPLVEVEVTGFNITEAHVTFLQDNYATPLVALGVLCDQAGQLITSTYFKRPVQMRQKGWHRAHRVGYHRGWVAD